MLNLLTLALFPVAQLGALFVAGWICWALSPREN